MAQLASDTGVPTPLIQAVLRHRDSRVTRRYEIRKGKGEVARLVGQALRTGATGRTPVVDRVPATERRLGDAGTSSDIVAGPAKSLEVDSIFAS